MMLEGMEEKDRTMYYMKHYVPDADSDMSHTREEEVASFDAFLSAAGAEG